MEASSSERMYIGRKVKGGDQTIMISFIEVFILVSIFGISYAMLQFASK